jgi:hypothetical protein
MSRRRADPHGEKGVTILLVAVAMFSILAMAVLAIEVASLYVVKAEAQRAADAGALAGAQALVAGGVTADPSQWPTACANAIQQAQAVAEQNPVGGVVLASSQVTVTFPNPPNLTDCGASANLGSFGINPQVQVVVQRNDLPAFFSRIWGVSSLTVTATAVAEAFNPSNSSTVSASGGTIPVAPRCVKPWVVPNLSPNPSLTGGEPRMFDPTTGEMSPGVVGLAVVLTNICSTSKTGSCVNLPPQAQQGYLGYFTAYISPGYNAYCPSSCTSGMGSDFAQAISCCYSLPTPCGIPNNWTLDLSVDRGTDTANAVACLIHAPGQDSLISNRPPVQITAGTGNPLVTAGAVSSGSYITGSNSIVTVPVYDNTPLPPNVVQPTVNVVGYLQVFVTNSDNSGNISGTILNVAGCVNANNGNPPVGAMSSSPIPVRLITPAD